jgi:hypothetical protein
MVLRWSPARLRPAAEPERSCLVAIEEIDSGQRAPIPRQGRIRRCSVRHVSIVPGDELPTVQVDCLLGGRDYPLPLGTMDEARPICNACTATTVWRADED